MSIVIPPELENVIDQDIQSGRSSDRADFLRKAVYHYLLARDLGEDYTREEIEQKITRGLAELERGEGIDGYEFFEQLRNKGEALRKRS